jgi:hypothetical protein
MSYQAFQVGDTVRVVSKTSPYHGLTGIVRSVDEAGMVPEPVHSHHVELEGVQTAVPSDPSIVSFRYEELELVSSAPE